MGTSDLSTINFFHEFGNEKLEPRSDLTKSFQFGPKHSQVWCPSSYLLFKFSDGAIRSFHTKETKETKRLVPSLLSLRSLRYLLFKFSDRAIRSFHTKEMKETKRFVPGIPSLSSLPSVQTENLTEGNEGNEVRSRERANSNVPVHPGPCCCRGKLV